MRCLPIVVSTLLAVLFAPMARAETFEDVLRRAGLTRDDLRVGADADWLGRPDPSAMPYLLPHLRQVQHDPMRLVALGTNLLHVAGRARDQRAVTGLFAAAVLQPRLAGFRGLPLELPAGGEIELPPAISTLRPLIAAVVEASRRVASSWRRVPGTTVDRAVSRLDVPRLLSGGSAWWPALDDAALLGDDVDRASAALLVLAAIEQVGEVAAPGFAGWETTTPQGRIVVAGTGSDRHECHDDCLLIVDLGGDDVYTGTAAAGVFPRQPVSVVLDLGGDDRYEAAGGPAQGAGLGGVGVLVDRAGDDVYTAGDAAQGFGLLGYGVLWDRGGRDRYAAAGGAQGAAVFGGGLLLDDGGDDVYRILGEGQGFGGPGACGVLADLQGDDDYFAEPDPSVAVGRADEHSEGRVAANNAQGAGVGRRGDLSDGHVWAGGVGVLLDLGGQDHYRAGNFAQAMGYWYGTGLLLDEQGDDLYESVYFSQGSSAHDGLALLWDGAGDDRHRLEQEAGASLGYGWDFGLGLFVDVAGNDQYRAAKTSLGAAQLSSLGLFLDLAGDDVYDVADRTRAFGWSARAAPSPPAGGPFRATDRARDVGLFVDLQDPVADPLAWLLGKTLP